MRHFVQYHNPDKLGQFRPSEKEFGIVTDKRFNGLVGSTVWLISRRDKPAEYVLCETFIVEKVGTNPTETLKNFASSSHGQPFDPPRRIDREPWFEILQKLTGNFAFGLQPINEEAVIQGLMAIASRL